MTRKILIDEATVKLALDYLDGLIRGLKMDDKSHAHQVAADLREALEEQPVPATELREQEPVAYDKTELNCFAQDLYDQKMREGKRGHYESMFHVIHQCIKKVTSPPAQRTWVELTDGEWMNIVNKDHAWFGQRPEDVAHEVAKLVETKLKEKNT